MGFLSDAAEGLRRVASRAGGDPYEIVAYRGYANDMRALVHGRVLESPNVSVATESDSLWRNLVNILKRVESDPVPGARASHRWRDGA